ncbi:GmrSD restriction endonuclease domain-containing protein [Nostocoides veronense]|uniref:DUF1524 domain-containing protein n=1 Tax=Nostocoides veronense TaxID=330836 RepID=A0ABP4YB66_9MICO
MLAVRQWLGDPGADGYPGRAEELAHVLREALQLVTIELLATEDSQEIFETLNARGTPLTAADLIRNFVFQLIEAEGGDTKRAYREDWPFESRFWAKEVSVGRYLVSRSSLFLNQWLVSRLGEEISPQSTFARFKSYVEHSTDSSMLKLLPTLRQQADLYEAWTEAAARRGGDLTPTEMAFYRMNASGIELLKPLLIWLHDPARPTPVSAEVVRRTITSVESWVYRRQLLRLTGSDLGRIVADLIRLNTSTPVDEIADRVSSHLSMLNVTSTYWPGDQEIELALGTDPVYRRFSRGRMRMFLEAIENAYRAETRQPQVERALYPIEHILPQKWEDNWRVDGREAQEERAAHVHRLGNLTLLTSSLNAKVSNGPWISKRQALLRHNTIKLIGRLVERDETTSWDEAQIENRTQEMVRVLLTVWPVPTGHLGRVVDIAAKSQDWIEVKHLIDAGLVIPGQELVSTHRDFPDATVTVAPDGHLLAEGRRFGTLSGAAKHFRGRVTNGWYFWSLPDGRRLRDVRTQFLSGTSSRTAPEDQGP